MRSETDAHARKIARTVLVYRLASLLMRVLSRLFLRLKVEGDDLVPREGSLLVVSNHISVMDPPFLAGTFPRPLAFMGKTELFRNRVLAVLLPAFRTFPVRRGEVDVGAVRLSLALLKDGQALVVFPEGTRHPDGLGAAAPGIGYLATKSRCRVLPVGIVGSQQIRGVASVLQRPTVRVAFGQPFTIDTKSNEEVADQIMRSIAALFI